jgi:hypothetical protein
MSDIAQDGPLSVYIGGSAPDIGSGGALLDLHGLIGRGFRFKAHLERALVSGEIDIYGRAAVRSNWPCQKGKVESAEGLSLVLVMCHTLAYASLFNGRKLC